MQKKLEKWWKHLENRLETTPPKQERYGPGLSLLEYLEKIDEDFLSAKNQSVPLLCEGQWMVLVYVDYLYVNLFVYFVYLQKYLDDTTYIS